MENKTSPDLDLSFRLLSHTSIRFANLPECLYLYRRHSSAIGVAGQSKRAANERRIREDMIRRLWGEAPRGALDRFQRLRFQRKLNWQERRAVKKDLRRLIDALIAHHCVEPEEEPLAHRRDEPAPGTSQPQNLAKILSLAKIPFSRLLLMQFSDILLLLAI